MGAFEDVALSDSWEEHPDAKIRRKRAAESAANFLVNSNTSQNSPHKPADYYKYNNQRKGMQAARFKMGIDIRQKEANNKNK